jgi:heparan-alpha-glucosaminide N-acetyltransferase
MGPYRHEARTLSAPTRPTRVVSLDALRGFTVFFMLFVNDVASVRDVPWWLYHMPRGVNGLTPVDVVFPAFLFMVGAAIPLAMDRRRAEGVSVLVLLRHVVLRSAALVVMGLFVMNGRQLDPVAAGVPYGVWNGLMLAALLLAWLSDPKADAGRQRVIRTVRVVAVVVLVILAATFRSKTPAAHGGWFDLTNWSVLGTIGWAYLTAATLCLWTRGHRVAMGTAFIALVAWNVGTRLGIAPVVFLARHFYPVANGGAASAVVAGILAAQLLLRERPPRRRLAELAIYAAGLALGGVALLSFGVSKGDKTPSYELFCAAITAVLLALFYQAIDVRAVWSGRPFLSAGRNALMVYLIPDIFYAIVGVLWLGRFGSGWTGAVGSMAFAVVWMAIGALLARSRMRVQL